MTGGLADFIEVVGLAARAKTLLGRGGTPVGNRDLSSVEGLELDHTGASEQEGRIVRGDEEVAAFDGVAALPEKVQVSGA